ncbi:MAG: LamG-like jellyroll fold domain-containing protein [Candidatus Marinimicrobia bacterium]|nr:LamG-like jellyroll fold domain-containing protein [Candidatus Neomarinimicrobiota bacterium]
MKKIEIIILIFLMNVGLYAIDKQYQVNSSSDDAEERAAGSQIGEMYLSSSDLEFVRDGNDQEIGIRFNNIDIPQNGIIDSAKLVFVIDEDRTTETNLNIYAQYTGNALEFNDNDYDITQRAKTSNSVQWNNVDPAAVGETLTSPDISAIIQEVINREDWSSGNSLAVIINGEGQRIVESYNGDSNNAPILNISFIAGEEDEGNGDESAGLVSFWNFNENSGSVAKDSVGDNNGVIYGASWTTGINGSALEFFGKGERLEVDNSNSLNIDGNQITLSTWFKLSEIKNAGGLIFKNSQYFLKINNQGKISFVLYIPSWSEISTDWGDRITDTNWHHVAGVYDGVEMKIYLDGKEFASQAVKGNIQLTTSDVWIGSQTKSLNNFNGKLDEIGIYNKALSESEIEDLYNSQSQTPSEILGNHTDEDGDGYSQGCTVTSPPECEEGSFTVEFEDMFSGSGETINDEINWMGRYDLPNVSAVTENNIAKIYGWKNIRTVNSYDHSSKWVKYSVQIVDDNTVAKVATHPISTESGEVLGGIGVVVKFENSIATIYGDNLGYAPQRSIESIDFSGESGPLQVNIYQKDKQYQVKLVRGEHSAFKSWTGSRDELNNPQTILQLGSEGSDSYYDNVNIQICEVVPEEMQGSGTKDDPYIILTLDHLQSINEDLDAYYNLGVNIDASETENWNNGLGFEPLGSVDSAFTGVFDGKGYIISNIYINRPDLSYSGLFGYIYRYGDGIAIIKNVGIESINIIAKNEIGGLVGYNKYGDISNCYVTEGSINGSGSVVGGLVGHNRGYIIDSYSTAVELEGYYGVGGLIGRHDYHISNTYAANIVNVRDTNTPFQGGLIGWVNTDFEPTVNNSFWDTEVSNQNTTHLNMGTGKTTAEMQDVVTFTDENTDGLDDAWDFINNPNNDTANEDIWIIEEDVYPFLTLFSDYGPDEPTPVTLIDFNASNENGNVVLNWNTASETDNVGYKIYRKLRNKDSELISSYSDNYDLKGQGNSTEKHNYEYIDSNVKASVDYTYILKNVDYSGTETKSGEVNITTNESNFIINDKYILENTYPNPFNSTFTIPLKLNESAFVDIKLINILGQKVLQIKENQMVEGNHNLQVNCNDLVSGTYFVRVTVDNVNDVQKVVLLK